MRILSVTAQKPNSTGSGVYLTELVKGFHQSGHDQHVLAGVYEDDTVVFPEGVGLSRVVFCSPEVTFPIAGMSDEMPYKSTVYGTMTKDMVKQFKDAFGRKLKEIVRDFCPDVILCHHLYLLTALTRELCPNHIVLGICHGTDLRQMKKIELETSYIRSHIQKLDDIFALHEEQKEDIRKTYCVAADRIAVIGSGYNSTIFYKQQVRKKGKTTLIYAGKLAEKKGVMSLLRSMQYLTAKEGELELCLAGGYGNQEEYDTIGQLAKSCRYPVKMLGKLNQEQLAEAFNQSDIFILPSYYEGLPLVVMEALACGLCVIITDLPGVRGWMDTYIPGNEIHYIKPPRMRNADEPYAEELPAFEKALADSIENERMALRENVRSHIELSKVTWSGVCQRIINCIKIIEQN